MKTYIAMSKTSKLFLLCSLLSLLLFNSAYAEIYYVSSITGSDSNPGSENLPFETINNALNQVGNGGDTIYVMEGTYVESIYISKNNITLTAYPGASPIIDGKNSLPDHSWGALIGVEGNNNTISGFEVRYSNYDADTMASHQNHGGTGVEIYPEGSGNKISNMNVHHTWEHGILIHGDDNIVEDSTIWQTALSNAPDSAGYEPRDSGWGSGLGVGNNTHAHESSSPTNNTSHTILRRNTVFNNWGEGIACYEVEYCTIEDNISYDNWTVNLYLSDATNSLVQRNLVYISSAPAISFRNDAKLGILLADEFGAVPRSAGNKIINNLVYNANFHAFSWSVEILSNPGLNNVQIANNTIIGGSLHTGGETEGIVNINSQIINNIITGTDNQISSASGIMFSNNNWSGDPSLAQSQSPTDITGDPQIAETGTTAPDTLTPEYFKLLAGSPVIDAGMALPCMLGGGSTDFFNNDRCKKMPDIGAHEF